MRPNRAAVLAITGMLIAGAPARAEAASLNPVIEMDDIANSEAKYTIIAAIKGYVPEKLLNQFLAHKGTIVVENTGFGTGGGYTTLLLYDDDTISFPTPAHMSINTEGEEAGHVDDYVLHEFGHVFDAINGVTNDELYRDILLSEMDAFNEAVAGYYEDKNHFTIPQEMFAELFAAYLDPENVFKAREKLKSAPKSVKVIEKVLKDNNYRKPDTRISNTYKEIEYGSTEVVKRMDLVPEGYLHTMKIGSCTYIYDSRKTDVTDEALLQELEKEGMKSGGYKFLTYENREKESTNRKSVTLEN